MEFNWSILVWIAGLIFVYIFGLYEGRSQGYKKRKAEEEQQKKDKPAPSPEIKTETVTVDDPGLLRVKNENGLFVLDLDGTRVNPISLSPDQRKRLIDMLSIMRPWLEGQSGPAPAPSAPRVQPRSTSVSDRLETFAGGPSESKPAPVQSASRPSPSVPQPTAPRPSTIAKEDRPSVPANSIVSQIDSVLQARLEGTALAERGIFLTQSPEGGVNVYVGLTRYNGIEDVPDPDIKAAIRAAISEWEDKYTPGLQR
jgi:cell division protein FtsN